MEENDLYQALVADIGAKSQDGSSLNYSRSATCTSGSDASKARAPGHPSKAREPGHPSGALEPGLAGTKKPGLSSVAPEPGNSVAREHGLSSVASATDHIQSATDHIQFLDPEFAHYAKPLTYMYVNE